jgi:hypothetical protein
LVSNGFPEQSRCTRSSPRAANSIGSKTAPSFRSRSSTASRAPPSIRRSPALRRRRHIKVGAPLLKGGKVTATVEKHGKGEKKVIVKFRRRKHYLRQGTHRQQYTQVKITGISA